MTRPFLFSAVGLALAGCSQASPVEETLVLDEAAIREASAPVAQAFMSALQAQLASAMAEGGAMQAVEVCHDVAPRIAAEQSEVSGASVSRVSDRNRNPDAGLTDELAPHYAALVETPLLDGAPANRVWLSGEGDQARANFLSAIPMRDQPCSACHGTDIDPALQARISELYPDDLATGFEPGELRGALLVSWPAAMFEDVS